MGVSRRVRVETRGIRAISALVLAGLAALLLAACALPQHMEVRAGIDPRHQDDDVRFRTTYYFRVFDACQGIVPREEPRSDATGTFTKDNEGPYSIAIDSLYRFHMTGKADSLFSKIHFESGTLHKSEIDPLGAAVVFDEKSGRFHFESREETERAAARNRQFDDLARLLAEYDRLKNSLKDKNGDIDAESKKLLGEFRNAIRGQITIIGGANLQPVLDRMDAAENAGKTLLELRGTLITALVVANTAVQDSAATPESKAAAIKMLKDAAETAARAAEAAKSKLVTTTDGTNQHIDTAVEHAEGSKTIDEPKKVISKIGEMVTAIGDAAYQLGQFNVASATKDALVLECGDARRGFQILGPEGWRTFNQDERLILAMSSSAKPLIGALKELSSRVLNEQPSRSAMLLPLVEERLRIVRAERVLDRLETAEPTAPKDALGKVIKQYDPPE